MADAEARNLLSSLPSLWSSVPFHLSPSQPVPMRGIFTMLDVPLRLPATWPHERNCFARAIANAPGDLDLIGLRSGFCLRDL